MLAASWLFSSLMFSHVCVYVPCAYRWWLLQHQSRHEWNRNFKLFLCTFYAMDWIKEKLYLISYVRLCFAFILWLFMLLFLNFLLMMIIYQTFFLLFGGFFLFFFFAMYIMCVVIIYKIVIFMFIFAYHFVVDFRIKKIIM